MSGPLAGITVLEVTDASGQFAGKLFADLGAEVIKVEPPQGDETRSWPPFYEDRPGRERSLWWWHYNTSKRSVVLDLSTAAGRERCLRLAAGADVLLLSGEGRDRYDYAALARKNPRLIMTVISPFALEGPRATEPATDLTLAANGGFAWMNGYDDHSLPPVRGGGNQAWHTGSHFAVMATLAALLERDVSGQGQRIDVDVNAALNVTTEAGSYTWLVNHGTVQRQTGRHAGITPSVPSQVRCADGRHVNTGLPPRKPDDFARMLKWLEDLGLIDEFPLAPLVEAGSLRERLDLSRIAEDEAVREIFGAGRAALEFIASRIGAYDFFSGGQSRGFQVGIIYAPEEVFSDPHFVARGWPVEVDHPELGRSFTYPGAPISFGDGEWSIRRRAPLLGEDTVEILGR